MDWFPDRGTAHRQTPNGYLLHGSPAQRLGRCRRYFGRCSIMPVNTPTAAVLPTSTSKRLRPGRDGMTPTLQRSSMRCSRKGIITADERLSAWDKRQPKREDDSAERVRRHRERALHTTENDTVTHRNADVTQSNAPDKIRSEEIRSEKTELLSSDEDSSCEKLPTCRNEKVQTGSAGILRSHLRCHRLGLPHHHQNAVFRAGGAGYQGIAKGGYSAANVRQFRDWWMPFDWRGQKGQAPTINQLRSDIGKIRQPVPAHQHPATGATGRAIRLASMGSTHRCGDSPVRRRVGS